MNQKSNITIFTDGSSRGNPGPGGYGVVVVAGDKVKELGEREKHTTNNRMELRAAIEALKGSTFLQIQGRTLDAVVYSDSSYLINGITKWIFGWQKNGWKTKAKKDVENRDLWEKLVDLAGNKNIEWKRIGGHAGVSGNERCDEIATSFADGEKPKLYNGPLSGYPNKKILDFSSDEKYLKDKTAARGRTRAAAYSYVSLVDGIVQTHKTWVECERRVKGVKGAKYKKVLTLAEEQETVNQFTPIPCV